MKYWRRKIGWWLMAIILYWMLAKFHDVWWVRPWICTGFIALGAYWMLIEGFRAPERGKDGKS